MTPRGWWTWRPILCAGKSPSSLHWAAHRHLQRRPRPRQSRSFSTTPTGSTTAGDPVQMGLLASLNRPGGNVTGIADLHMQLAAKRLGFLYELLPRATRLAVLVNPNSRVVQTEIAEAQAAAAAIGR